MHTYNAYIHIPVGALPLEDLAHLDVLMRPGVQTVDLIAHLRCHQNSDMHFKYFLTYIYVRTYIHYDYKLPF